MNMQELGTIAPYGIKVKIAILNNGWLGMVRQWQHLFYGDRYEATNLEKGTPDFANKLAEIYGIKSLTGRSLNSSPMMEPCFWISGSPAPKTAIQWWFPVQATIAEWDYILT